VEERRNPGRMKKKKVAGGESAFIFGSKVVAEVRRERKKEGKGGTVLFL